jgi:hypothetical protein
VEAVFKCDFYFVKKNNKRKRLLPQWSGLKMREPEVWSGGSAARMSE